MRKLVAIAALLSLLAACHPVMEVSSPDGRILVQADVDSDGQPLYAVEVDGLPLIGWSQLGLVAEGIDLSAGFRLQTFQFFRDFEADCDASEALQGEVGEYIAVVRRAGDRFFYGATTDETPRTLMQPLSFLRPGVTYTATLYADAPDADWQTNPYAYVIEQRTVTSNDTLTLPLAASGGCAISFLPL